MSNCVEALAHLEKEQESTDRYCGACELSGNIGNVACSYTLQSGTADPLDVGSTEPNGFMMMPEVSEGMRSSPDATLNSRPQHLAVNGVSRCQEQLQDLRDI